MREPALFFHSLQERANGIPRDFPVPRQSATHFVGGHFTTLPNDLHDLALSRGEVGQVRLFGGHRRLPFAMVGRASCGNRIELGAALAIVALLLAADPGFAAKLRYKLTEEAVAVPLATRWEGERDE
jgi:hypothetical protein